MVVRPVHLPGNSSAFVWRFSQGLGQNGRQFHPFAIVGQYAVEPKGFVQHVALLVAQCEVSSASQVSVWHMGPPLRVTDPGASASVPAGECRADLVIEIPLAADDRNAMLHWKSKVEKERRPSALFQQYVIDPPIVWIRSETGRKLYRRFSCAGFVMSCYASAGIFILNQETDFPAASLADVERAYPQLRRLLQMAPAAQAKLGFRDLADFGIPGDGPWQIVLAGYIFHSCHRLTAATHRLTPYSPISVKEAFYP